MKFTERLKSSCVDAFHPVLNKKDECPTINLFIIHRTKDDEITFAVSTLQPQCQKVGY